MPSKKAIRAKYREFYKKYSHRNIDDYETYVRSRVVEYFFCLQHVPIDGLVYAVNKAMDNDTGKTNRPEIHLLVVVTIACLLLLGFRRRK